ncbi:methyltransferase [Pseudonocardia nigra]|uniref:methyltransferase n=1 Tax=Pseudonocardia nigra TaxID=1921578 RepID=UPI001C5FF17B|nr:methyltransferase [Pseudonocardia nigra]
MSAVATPADRAAQMPPHEIVWELSNAIVASRTLHVVAELGGADHLGDEPTSARDLATACHAAPDALDRALRLLVACGIFQRRDGAYLHTESSRLLRSDHPRSMRAFARLNGLPVICASFVEFGHSVRTGSPALELIDPKGLWHYLQDHQEEAAIFEQAMTAKAHADIAAVLDAYDFSRHRRIADIAGGHGHLITAILAHYEDASGVLFKLPAVAAEVPPPPRLDVVAGDFFTDPLPACDARRWATSVAAPWWRRTHGPARCCDRVGGAGVARGAPGRRARGVGLVVAGGGPVVGVGWIGSGARWGW